MKMLGGCFVFEKTIFDEKLRGKCLGVSGKISTFALNESKTVRQPFLRLTRTTIFMRGCFARCTCQLETGTGLQPTRPIDCVRGASHVVT